MLDGMAHLNRCAVTVRPRQPMLDWLRPFAIAAEQQSVLQECSLYLIPCYEQDVEAWQRLRDVSAHIFQSELELWCRDPGRWPQDRSHGVFLAWFSVCFHPLVDDLASEPLHRATVDPGFRDLLRQTLERDPLDRRIMDRRNADRQA
jgi:hypothetical protein